MEIKQKNYTETIKLKYTDNQRQEHIHMSKTN